MAEVSCPEAQLPTSPHFGSDAVQLLSSSQESTACSSDRGDAEVGSPLKGSSPYHRREIAYATQRSACRPEDEDDRSLGDMSSEILSQFAYCSESSVQSPSSAAHAHEGAPLPDFVSSEVALDAVQQGRKDSSEVAVNTVVANAGLAEEASAAPGAFSEAVPEAAPEAAPKATPKDSQARIQELKQIMPESVPPEALSGKKKKSRTSAKTESIRKINKDDVDKDFTISESPGAGTGNDAPVGSQPGSADCAIETELRRNLDKQAAAVVDVQQRLEEWQEKVCSLREEVQQQLGDGLKAQISKECERQLQELRKQLWDEDNKSREAMEADLQAHLDKVVSDLKQEWHERFQVVEGELRGGMVAQATETLGMRRELTECHVRIQAHSEVTAAGQLKLETMVKEKLNEQSVTVPDKHAGRLGESSDRSDAACSDAALRLKLQDEMRSCNSLCEASAASCAEAHAKLKDEVNRRFEAHSAATNAVSMRSQEKTSALEEQLVTTAAAINSKFDTLSETASAATNVVSMRSQKILRLEEDVSKRLEIQEAAVSEKSAEAWELSHSLRSELAAVAASHANLEAEVSKMSDTQAAAVSAESVKAHEAIKGMQNELATASASHAKLEVDVMKTLKAQVASSLGCWIKSQAAIQRIEAELAAASESHAKIEGELHKSFETSEAAISAESMRSQKVSQRLAEELAAAAVSHANFESEVGKAFEAHTAAASAHSLLLEEQSLQLEAELHAVSIGHAKMEEEINKKIQAHAEAASAASMQAHEASQRLESAAQFQFEDSVNKRLDAHAATLATVSVISEEASARLQQHMDSVSEVHVKFENETRQKFEYQSMHASRVHAQLRDAVSNDLMSQSSTAALLHAQLESELQGMEKALKVESQRVHRLEEETKLTLKAHKTNVSEQLEETRQDQAAIVGDMLRKTHAAELQRDADFACLESELQVACERFDRVCESQWSEQDVLRRVQESLTIHKMDLGEVCRRTEQVSESRSAEALGWLKSYAEAHEADRVDAWERIEKEVLSEGQEMQIQGRKLRNELGRMCEEQSQALRELCSRAEDQQQSFHYELAEVSKQCSRAEDQQQSLQYELSEVSKQRVAEMAEAQRLEDAALCQAAGVHVMAQLHEALEAQCAVLRNVRRSELLGRGPQLSTTAEWRELIDDVRQVMATRYMESLEVCRTAEDLLTEAPAEAAAMLAARLTGGNFAAVSLLSEEQSPQREVRTSWIPAPPAAPAGKRPASARPAARAAHMSSFSASTPQPAAKYPGRLKDAVRGCYGQASNVETG